MKKYEHRAQYYETDQMGIIHHANYIRWFEEARIDMMDQLGISYAKVEELGILVPVLGVSCQYHQPVHFNEILVIETRLTRLSGIKLSFSYKVIARHNGSLCCTGESNHCFLDKAMRPLRLQKHFPEIYALFLQELEPEN